MEIKNWKYVFSNDDLFHERIIHFRIYKEFIHFTNNHVVYDDNCKFIISEIEQWCEENFEEKFLLGISYILCDSEEDFLAFRLRWM